MYRRKLPSPLNVGAAAASARDRVFDGWRFPCGQYFADDSRQHQPRAGDPRHIAVSVDEIRLTARPARGSTAAARLYPNIFGCDD